MAMFSPTPDQWVLPGRLGELVSGELAEGEHVLWLAQPDPKRYARKALPAVLFGIPWTAFAIFWMAGASGFKMPDFSKGFGFFPLFGVPFVLIGLGMLSSPLWAMRKAKRTVYVLTDRRAILLEGGRSAKIRSFGPEQLESVERRERGDGSGDILFSGVVTFAANTQQATMPIGFLGVPNVRETERLLHEMVEAHRGRPQVQA
ncbi:MAG: hypothetical protein V2A58_18385 [Planctomycetota bacterium]